MKAPPAQPGHLKDHDLNLQVTDQVRAGLSKAQKAVEAFKRIKPVHLDWKRKS